MKIRRLAGQILITFSVFTLVSGAANALASGPMQGGVSGKIIRVTTPAKDGGHVLMVNNMISDPGHRPVHYDLMEPVWAGNAGFVEKDWNPVRKGAAK